MNNEEAKIKVLDNCVSKGCSLIELVEYASDSVVSKTIVDSKIGTITLFAFDSGQKLSEHTSPYNAVVQVIDGYGLFNIAGREIKVTSGQIVIMPANVPHAVNASEKFKMLLTMIRA